MKSEHKAIIRCILSIIISIIGAICLGICVYTFINHIVECKLDGTQYSEQICIIDGSGPSIRQFKYHYFIEDQHSNEIIIIVTFLLTLICIIISYLCLKIDSKLKYIKYFSPLLYFFSIILFNNRIDDKAMYSSNIIVWQRNNLIVMYTTNVKNIIIVLTIIYIILIACYFIHKKVVNNQSNI